MYDVLNRVSVDSVLGKAHDYEVELAIFHHLPHTRDTETFPTAEFKAIYHMRWDVEGFYKILKSRLTLENFTGKTAYAVYQDFYAAVYLIGLDTILTGDVNESLSGKSVPLKVGSLDFFFRL